MNKFMVTNTARFAGASSVRSIDSTRQVERIPIDVIRLEPPPTPPTPPPPPPLSLPLTSSQVGNLFVDRNDSNLHWYLPDYALADDIDPAFAFTASQQGQDSEGHPFNTAKLTLRLRKVVPDDASKLAQDNPAAKLQEIPLAEMTAVLTSVYTDDKGQEGQRTFNATIQDAGDGFSLLTFDGSILGKSVIGLYQDLSLFGKAVISLSASYQAWSPQVAVFLTANIQAMAFKPMFMEAGAQTHVAAFAMRAQPSAAAPVSRMRTLSAEFFRNPGARIERPPSPPLVQTRQTWAKAIPLGLKYKKDGYQLEFTVSTTTVASHVIRDASDLQDFSLSQSEFTELKALGNISERYPSLSRAYIGVLSRSIVVIPQRYSIVRNHLGCAALCMALVDSAATDGSKCKFEFDFMVAPEVSRIEFLKLAQEIATRTDLKDYKLRLPDFLRDTPASSLDTDFKSTVQFAPGADPHTFAVTTVIHDDGGHTPAVANANLFIMRLAHAEAPLIGSLSLKLDDGYAQPVVAPVVLNFSHTTSATDVTGATDEMEAAIDEAATQIKLTNRSPLDLQVSKYALIQGSTLTEVPNAFALPGNGSASLPLPANHDGLQFAADSQLALPEHLSKADIARLLQFQTADVQQTQYVVAVNGSGIDFNKVDSLMVSITFTNLPSVTPRPLSLSKNVHADSTHIIIPLENAVFSLPGTVNLTVHFVDPGLGDLNFTVENDFTAEPVLILLQSEIEKNLPNA